MAELLDHDLARDAQINFAVGRAKPEDIAAQLVNAEDLTHFSYSGLQDAASRPKAVEK